jgi:uncharacterized membrane protein
MHARLGKDLAQMDQSQRLRTAGLLLLTLAVTPANVYMLQRWDLFPVPYWVLVARLALQIVVLLVIAWSTNVRTLFRS